MVFSNDCNEFWHFFHKLGYFSRFSGFLFIIGILSKFFDCLFAIYGMFVQLLVFQRSNVPMSYRAVVLPSHRVPNFWCASNNESVYL